MNRAANTSDSSRNNIKFSYTKVPLASNAAWELECFLIKIFEYGDYSFRSALLGRYSGTLACVFSLARNKGKLIGAAGCLYAHKNPAVAIIGPVGVIPKYRRKGVGTELVKLLITHLQSLRSLAAYLSVPISNRAAKFYEEIGFRRYAGITMRYLFQPAGKFEESYYGKSRKTKIRRVAWGDFPGIQALSVFPCSIYTFDFRQSIFSCKYVPPTRFLPIFPEMMKAFEKYGGLANILVSGQRENIVGIAHISKSPASVQRHVGTLDFYVHDNFICNLKHLVQTTIKDSAYLSIKKINCYCLACDFKKQNILKSLGTRQIAALPRNIIIGQHYHDVFIYELENPDVKS